MRICREINVKDKSNKHGK